MVTYQFDVDEDTWTQWKNTVPRSKSLDERLRELIVADTDGRVHDAADETAATAPRERREGATTPVAEEGDTPPTGDAVAAVVSELSFPQGVDRDDAADAIRAAHEYLHTRERATQREIVASVMPDQPLKYDVPQLEEGDRYRGAWWRRVVKPGLEGLDDVQKPEGGQNHWRISE